MPALLEPSSADAGFSTLVGSPFVVLEGVCLSTVPSTPVVGTTGVVGSAFFVVVAGVEAAGFDVAGFDAVDFVVDGVGSAIDVVSFVKVNVGVVVSSQVKTVVGVATEVAAGGCGVGVGVASVGTIGAD